MEPKRCASALPCQRCRFVSGAGTVEKEQRSGRKGEKAENEARDKSTERRGKDLHLTHAERAVASGNIEGADFSTFEKAKSSTHIRRSSAPREEATKLSKAESTVVLSSSTAIPASSAATAGRKVGKTVVSLAAAAADTAARAAAVFTAVKMEKNLRFRASDAARNVKLVGSQDVELSIFSKAHEATEKAFKRGLLSSRDLVSCNNRKDDAARKRKHLHLNREEQAREKKARNPTCPDLPLKDRQMNGRRTGWGKRPRKIQEENQVRRKSLQQQIRALSRQQLILHTQQPLENQIEQQKRSEQRETQQNQQQSKRRTWRKNQQQQRQHQRLMQQHHQLQEHKLTLPQQQQQQRKQSSQQKQQQIDAQKQQQQMQRGVGEQRRHGDTQQQQQPLHMRKQQESRNEQLQRLERRRKQLCETGRQSAELGLQHLQQQEKRETEQQRPWGALLLQRHRGSQFRLERAGERRAPTVVCEGEEKARAVKRKSTRRRASTERQGRRAQPRLFCPLFLFLQWFMTQGFARKEKQRENSYGCPTLLYSDLLGKDETLHVLWCPFRPFLFPRHFRSSLVLLFFALLFSRSLLSLGVRLSSGPLLFFPQLHPSAGHASTASTASTENPAAVAVAAVSDFGTVAVASARRDQTVDSSSGKQIWQSSSLPLLKGKTAACFIKKSETVFSPSPSRCFNFPLSRSLLVASNRSVDFTVCSGTHSSSAPRKSVHLFRAPGTGGSFAWGSLPFVSVKKSGARCADVFHPGSSSSCCAKDTHSFICFPAAEEALPTRRKKLPFKSGQNPTRRQSLLCLTLLSPPAFSTRSRVFCPSAAAALAFSHKSSAWPLFFSSDAVSSCGSVPFQCTLFLAPPSSTPGPLHLSSLSFPSKPFLLPLASHSSPWSPSHDSVFFFFSAARPRRSSIASCVRANTSTSAPVPISRSKIAPAPSIPLAAGFTRSPSLSALSAAQVRHHHEAATWPASEASPSRLVSAQPRPSQLPLLPSTESSSTSRQKELPQSFVVASSPPPLQPPPPPLFASPPSSSFSVQPASPLFASPPLLRPTAITATTSLGTEPPLSPPQASPPKTTTPKTASATTITTPRERNDDFSSSSSAFFSFLPSRSSLRCTYSPRAVAGTSQRVSPPSSFAPTSSSRAPVKQSSFSQTRQSVPSSDVGNSTFVSAHSLLLSAAAIEAYLHRKRLEFVESEKKYTLKFCPACPPHHYRRDNLFKLEVFKNSGNCYCHRCNWRASFFDLKARLGDLPPHESLLSAAAAAAAARPAARFGPFSPLKNSSNSGAFSQDNSGLLSTRLDVFAKHLEAAMKQKRGQQQTKKRRKRGDSGSSQRQEQRDCGVEGRQHFGAESVSSFLEPLSSETEGSLTPQTEEKEHGPDSEEDVDACADSVLNYLIEKRGLTSETVRATFTLHTQLPLWVLCF